MASIDKVGPKKYRARYRTPDGASRSRTFTRRIDAENLLTSVESSKLQGLYVDRSAGRVALRTYVAEHLERQPWRPRTKAVAATSLSHALGVMGDRPLASIRPSDVQAFVAGLELAPSTVRVVVQHLRTVMRSAVRDNIIARDPTSGVKLPRAAGGVIVPPSDEQVQALYEAADPVFRGGVVLGAAVGLRAAEAMGLTADRIDWLRRTVRIDRQWSQVGGWAPPKTRASTRTIPVAGEVLEVLSEHIAEFGLGGEGSIVHWANAGHDGPMHHMAWARAMRKAVAGAELADVSFHDLRHHYASKLIAAGCSVKAVQAALGHEKASTTLDTYGHLWPGDDDRIRAAVGSTWKRPVSDSCHEDLAT
jgi:integrase